MKVFVCFVTLFVNKKRIGFEVIFFYKEKTLSCIVFVYWKSVSASIEKIRTYKSVFTEN